MAKKTVTQLVILYHPNNKFSFYSDNEEVFKTVWKKSVCENKLFYHKPEVNFLIDFVHEISKKEKLLYIVHVKELLKFPKT